MSKFIIIEGTDNVGKDTQINLIFNRSHLGETVYSPLYRGYSGDYVFDIEKKYTKALRENLYLITLTNNPHTILKRDDGKSFYGNEEEVKAEVDGFKRAHKLSTIKNKLHVHVGNMSAIEVSHIILAFLKRENKITGESKQLNMFQ